MNKILFVGGHGMLGRPVIRHLVEQGFVIRALSRDIDRARAVLPEAVEVVQGDLEDPPSIRRAAEGMEAVYLNLETPNPGASFRPDYEGVKNVIAALDDRPEVMIAKISGFGLRHTSGWWPGCDLKFKGEALIKRSGHPYLLFHPTWFLESLNLFVRGKRATLFGRKWYPLRWIAGDDYGKMVGVAFKKGVKNRTFNVQGPEALDFDQALERFLNVRGPEVKVTHLPLALLQILGVFVPFAKDFHRLFHLAANEDTGFQSQDTWDELYKPEMTIEDYCRYIEQTRDIPQKG